MAHKISLDKRLSKWTDKSGPPFGTLGPCWIWTGALRATGYGAIVIDRKSTTAHRAAYEYLIGRVPDGLQLDHLCRNRACCNPAHLEPVTAKENLLRGSGIAANNARKTHCHRGHELSGDNLRISPVGARLCIECHRLKNKKLSQQRKEARHARGLRIKRGAPSLVSKSMPF